MLIYWVCQKHKMNANKKKYFLVQTMVRKKKPEVFYTKFY